MLARLMGLTTIAPDALHRMLAESVSRAVYDVNAPASWMRARVPGAINLESAGFTVDQLPADRATPLVFYCSGPLCMKAPSAARRAAKMGYEDVRVMAAGITGWQAAGLPTEQGTTLGTEH